MAVPDPYRSALSGFAALVDPAREDASIDLASAALAIARTEYPGLDVRHYVGRLEILAGRVRGRMRSNPTAREAIAMLNRVLFEEEGLRGNRDDYYDAAQLFPQRCARPQAGHPHHALGDLHGGGTPHRFSRRRHRHARDISC